MTNNTTALVLTDEQVDTAIRAVCHSDPTTKYPGEYCVTIDELRALLTSPRAAVPAPEGWKLVPIERSYDMRVKALLAFNTTEKETNDRDDALDAAHRAMLDATPAAPVATWHGINRKAVQQAAIEHGFVYWREPDAHGVEGTIQQATGLLQYLLAVEVEIKPDEPECATCDGHGMIGGPSFYTPDEGGVACPDCAQAVAADGVAQDDIEGIARAAGCTNIDLIGDRAKAIERLTAFAVRVRAAVSPATAEPDDWRWAVQGAISHLDYETDAPSNVKTALRQLRDALRGDAPATADERAAFEAWVRTDALPFDGEDPCRRGQGGYAEDHVQTAWVAWQAARASQAAAPAEAREPECPRCNGSGEAVAYTDNGPDAIEETVNCPYCNGHGTLAEAYTGVVAALEKANNEYLALCGKQYFVPADAGEAVAWICSGSNDFAPIVRDRAAALRLSQEYGDGKIVALGIMPDVVSQGAQGGKSEEADCGCATNQACAMKKDGSCWRAD